MRRDFTYIDDIVESVHRLADHPAEPNPEWSGDKPDPGTSYAPYRVYNIGNSSPVDLMYMIEVLEKRLGLTAKKILLPLQPGDVPATYADVEDLTRAVGFKPETSIEEGVSRFVDGYKDFYGA